MPEPLDFALPRRPRYLANRRIEKTILLLVLFLGWQLYAFIRDFEELLRSGAPKPRLPTFGAAAKPLRESIVCATVSDSYQLWEGSPVSRTTIYRCSAEDMDINAMEYANTGCLVFSDEASAERFIACMEPYTTLYISATATTTSEPPLAASR